MNKIAFIVKYLLIYFIYGSKWLLIFWIKQLDKVKFNTQWYLIKRIKINEMLLNNKKDAILFKNCL